MAAKIKRRELLVGVASSAILPSLAGSAGTGDLASLGLQFRQLVERTQLLEHQKSPLASGSGAAWKAWSDAVTAAEELAGQLEQSPARSLIDLSIKLDALICEFSHDGPNESSIEKLMVWQVEFKQLVQPVNTHS